MGNRVGNGILFCYCCGRGWLCLSELVFGLDMRRRSWSAGRRYVLRGGCLGTKSLRLAELGEGAVEVAGEAGFVEGEEVKLARTAAISVG